MALAARVIWASCSGPVAQQPAAEGDPSGPVGEWRSGGERKRCLGNLPPTASPRALASAIKARSVCGRAHQQLKQEFGLGRFGGRPWTGPHRHALVACTAFAHLRRLRPAGQRSTGPGKNAASRSGAAPLSASQAPVSATTPC